MPFRVEAVTTLPGELVRSERKIIATEEAAWSYAWRLAEAYSKGKAVIVRDDDCIYAAFARSSRVITVRSI